MTLERRRRFVLSLLIALAILTFLDRIAISVAATRIQEELGISPERWGWILGAFILAYGIFEIPTGAMGDRIGQRRVLSRIVLWWSGFTALTGLAPNFTVLLSTRFLFGMGEAGAYPNISGVIVRWYPVVPRARMQGYIWAASRLGGALAPPLVVALQATLGWRYAFLLLGAAGLVWAAAWWAFYRDADPAHGVAQSGAHVSVPWAHLARQRQLWLIFAMYFCQAWGSWFYFGWFPVYLVRGAGFAESEMGLFAALPYAMGALGNVAGGFLSDRLTARHGLKIGRCLVASSSLAVSGLLLAAMSRTHDKAAIVILSSLGFGIADLMLPAAWAVCLDMGHRYAGAVTGTMNTAGQLGAFCCSLFFGYAVLIRGNYQDPLWGVAAMVLIASFLFARIDPTRSLVAGDLVAVPAPLTPPAS